MCDILHANMLSVIFCNKMVYWSDKIFLCADSTYIFPQRSTEYLWQLCDVTISFGELCNYSPREIREDGHPSIRSAHFFHVSPFSLFSKSDILPTLLARSHT